MASGKWQVASGKWQVNSHVPSRSRLLAAKWRIFIHFSDESFTNQYAI
ncbi:hypothetical protein JCM19237_733 [Photobacterium aphoticum]|uniref:Uncharacterized protein n=1 Tax=Photobacterium aphoticum TaxID=754436 RepID=A0A090R303_9GAMM|nr:hypothetical protein JCM19237_733 [Photobacterium aphoticum]